jgi:hypothetical protein
MHSSSMKLISYCNYIFLIKISILIIIILQHIWSTFFFFLRMTGLLHLSSMKALRQEWWTTSTSTHSREINKSLDSSSIKIPITTSQNKNFLQLDSISESSIYQKTSSTFVLLTTPWGLRNLLLEREREWVVRGWPAMRKKG